MISQVPTGGCLNLDHVASFVPDREACDRALSAVGFAPAPFSLQYHRLGPDSDLVPAGTGNHCVMLREGYLEYLVPVADTPVAAQLRASIQRYIGAHSIVFGTGDAHLDHRRLESHGFSPLPPIALQREVETPAGAETARFTVVRVPPGSMAEGRIQFCRHHTEQFVWQPRWLDHPNGAVALNAVIACVEDPDEAADRYGRFTGVVPERTGDGGRRLQLQRGRVDLLDPQGLRRQFGIDAPTQPWIAGCEIACVSLTGARETWRRHGLVWQDLSAGKVLIVSPEAIGGMFVFVDA